MCPLLCRFGPLLCLGHCCEELAKHPEQDYDVAAVDMLLSSCPPGMLDLASLPAILSAATDSLLRQLGDAEALGNAVHATSSTPSDSNSVGGLQHLLLQLSQPAAIVLFSSNAIQTRSENSVLMMVDVWMQGAAAQACTQSQKRDVAGTLRLSQLSHTFLFDVLPELPWLQLTPAEHVALLRFVASEPKRRACRPQPGPAAWYSLEKRAAWTGPAASRLEAVLTRQELQRLLTANGTVVVFRHTPAVSMFHGGLICELSLTFQPAPSSP